MKRLLAALIVILPTTVFAADKLVPPPNPNVITQEQKAQLENFAKECSAKGGNWGIHEKGNIPRCKGPEEDKLKEECLAKGGQFAGVYPSPCVRTKDMCNYPTKDAGKKCSNKSDCESECVWDADTKEAKCAPWIGPGYGGSVVNGKPQPPIGCM